MFSHLLKSNILKIKQVLLCSACFLMFTLSCNAQKWEALPGLELNKVVNSIIVDSIADRLLIGGQYLQEIDGQSTASVFGWQPESGVQIFDTNNTPHMPVIIPWGIIKQNDSFFIAGDNGVSKLHGDSFTNAWYDYGGRIWDIYSYHGEFLLSVGLDDNFGNKGIGHLIEWDGDTTFSEFQNISNYLEPTPSINTAIVYNHDLYVGGNSRSEFGGIMDYVMKWDGSSWQKVGNGIQTSDLMSTVYAMEVYQGELYVAGLFYQDGPIKENHIARWDGTQWKTVGGGFEDDIFGYSQVAELYVHGGYLYAGGRFGSAGGVPAEGIARWDGYEWCGCGSNILEQVMTIDHYRDTLYVGGNFGIYTPQDSIYNIARFIGSEFADTCGSTAVGIKTIASERKQLVGYPNPAQNEIYLELPKLENTEASVYIHNSVGQLVYQQLVQTTNNPIKLPIESLPKGMYFGNLTTSQNTYVFSFIKE